MQPTIRSAVAVAAILTTLLLTALFFYAAHRPAGAEWPAEASDYVCDGPYRPRVISDGEGGRFLVCDPT